MNNLTVMFTVKKAVKFVVEKDQWRILAVLLAHDGELIVKEMIKLLVIWITL